jgi:hypothetical protein
MFLSQPRSLLVFRTHRLAEVTATLCLLLLGPPAVEQMVGDAEVPGYLSHKPCRVAHHPACLYL